ncbi:uncharacterized protein LOC116108801 [Pistacia vera]|uniref:uncharacterized protein LOC116108801 n=1 Tax=Pistacia vera TaxID=55513 RepID=UPI00126358A2|nr:uncharacterized protein LOC116108801 [Pistacia vera]
MRGALGGRDHQNYYRYHQDIGHNTNECKALKDTIEDLIRRGHLKEFVKEEPTRENLGEQTNQIKKNQVNNDLLLGMIYGGPNIVGSFRHSREQYAWEARTNSIPRVMNCEQKRLKIKSEVIGFTNEECDQSPRHNHDAIIITARIDNARIVRVMVDNGSATNIIFL